MMVQISSDPDMTPSAYHVTLSHSMYYINIVVCILHISQRTALENKEGNLLVEKIKS